MRHPIRVLFAALLLCIAAPATAQDAEPAPEAPAPEVPQSRDRLPTVDTGIESVEITSSRSLSLDDAVEQARKANPDLKIVRKRLEQAQLLQRKAWSLIIPSVQAQVIYTRYDQEITAAFGPGVEAVIRPIDEVRAIGTISSRFDGRLFPQLDSALLAEDLARVSEADLQRELRYGIAQLYYQLLAIERLIDIQESSLDSRRVVLAAAQARRDAGAGTEFEVTRATTEVIRAQSEVEKAKLSFIGAREALSALIVTPADFSIVKPEPLEDPPPIEEAIEQAQDSRPDMVRAKMNTRLADNELDTLYWTYAPTLAATLTLSQQEETAFSGDAFSWQFQLVAAWTLYDGGLREANISEAESRLDETRIEREKLAMNLRADLQQAYTQLRSARIQLQAREREVALARQGLKQAQDGYRLGALRQLDVLDAELALRIARIQQSNDVLDARLALHSIYRLVGQSGR